jgi:hypothetical protein
MARRRVENKGERQCEDRFEQPLQPIELASLEPAGSRRVQQVRLPKVLSEEDIKQNYFARHLPAGSARHIVRDDVDVWDRDTGDLLACFRTDATRLYPLAQQHLNKVTVSNQRGAPAGEIDLLVVA